MLRSKSLSYCDKRMQMLIICISACIRRSLFEHRDALALTRVADWKGNSSAFSALLRSLWDTVASDGFLVITADILGYNYQRHELREQHRDKKPLLDMEFPQWLTSRDRVLYIYRAGGNAA